MDDCGMYLNRTVARFFALEHSTVRIERPPLNLCMAISVDGRLAVLHTRQNSEGGKKNLLEYFVGGINKLGYVAYVHSPSKSWDRHTVVREVF